MKKLFKITFIAAFVIGIGYNIYTNQKTDIMSDLMQANVEALANDEFGTTCIASISCSDNPVSCTGTYSERESFIFGKWVKCDGQ